MRVACVALPALALQAWRRADPELATAPLAIAEGAVGSARLIAISGEARALGVRPGLTAATARSLAPSLIVRASCREREAAARAALLDACHALAPAVEADGWSAGDSALLEIGDLGRLYPTERAVALELQRLARRLGLDARVAVAASKGVARLAAWSCPDPITIVPSGSEAECVAPLPVSALRPSERALAALERWGVRSCGRLAGLPSREVALRLGREGGALARLAAGRCDEPVAARPPDDETAEGVELDFELSEIEPLLFVLRGLADRLLERLAARHLACAGVTLRLQLSPSGNDVREVNLAAPTHERGTLLEIIRLAVEERPPESPVVGVALVARAGRVSRTQLDLFRPAGPSPDRLATTVARLQALVGEGRVGRVRPADSHRDEAFTVERFAGGGHAPAAMTEAAEARLTLRRFRPPRTVEVLLDGGSVPRLVTGVGSVAVAAGPYRVSGEWWSSGGFARDHWDLHASDGALYRLFRDAAGAWFLEGYYD